MSHDSHQRASGVVWVPQSYIGNLTTTVPAQAPCRVLVLAEGLPKTLKGWPSRAQPGTLWSQPIIWKKRSLLRQDRTHEEDWGFLGKTRRWSQKVAIRDSLVTCWLSVLKWPFHFLESLSSSERQKFELIHDLSFWDLRKKICVFSSGNWTQGAVSFILVCYYYCCYCFYLFLVRPS